MVRVSGDWSRTPHQLEQLYMGCAQFLVVCLTILMAAGCAAGDVTTEGTESRTKAASWALICVDEDGDGFGPNCGSGDDCDDSDPATHQGCEACKTPEDGCDCVPGTEAVACTLDRSVKDDGSLLCLSGVRYCRDGEWTECQGVAQYEVPAPSTEWVEERVAADSDPEDAALRCDPCRELWGPQQDGR